MLKRTEIIIRVEKTISNKNIRKENELQDYT